MGNFLFNLLIWPLAGAGDTRLATIPLPFKRFWTINSAVIA